MMRLLLLTILLTFVSCGEYDIPVETKLISDANSTPPTLTAENHGQGWKESSCYMCHVSDGIHPGMDYMEESSCLYACHGDNGL